MSVLFAAALLACSSGVEHESAPRETPQREAPSRVIERGPCASDADCHARVDGCDCSCDAMLRSSPLPSDSEWATMCNGGPPRNCGVASPCMPYTARCDATSHECVLAEAR